MVLSCVGVLGLGDANVCIYVPWGFVRNVNAAYNTHAREGVFATCTSVIVTSPMMTDSKNTCIFPP